MLEINGEKTVNIEGEDMWTARSFAELTQRSVRVVRKLVLYGNRIRKLKGKTINGRMYIYEQELFDFEFTTGGRPADMGDFVERFYMEEGELLREEACVKPCRN